MNYILTKNRNINLFAKNKCSSFNDEEIPNYLSKLTFESQMRNKYNKLPRGITLAPTKHQFKKWLFKFDKMTEFNKFPLRKDNIAIFTPKFSHQINFYCTL